MLGLLGGVSACALELACAHTCMRVHVCMHTHIFILVEFYFYFGATSLLGFSISHVRWHSTHFLIWLDTQLDKKQYLAYILDLHLKQNQHASSHLAVLAGQARTAALPPAVRAHLTLLLSFHLLSTSHLAVPAGKACAAAQHVPPATRSRGSSTLLILFHWHS